MLKRIDLQQFKCFEELHLPLAQLTLLTGLNAAGKSSVLQALVLMHQTMMENVGSRELDIDGSVISLGTVADVLNQNTGKNRFGIGLAWEDSACFWDFATNNRRTLTIPLVSFQWWNGEEAPTNFSIYQNL